MISIRHLLVTLSFFVALQGCNFFPGVHKLNIQQGHIITPDMVAKLTLGMSKKQVRFVLGNTLIPDTLNDDRWDYFYSLRRGKDDSYTQHIFSVYFENDKLVKMEGDYLAGPAPLNQDKSEKIDDSKRDLPLPTNIEDMPKDEDPHKKHSSQNSRE